MDQSETSRIEKLTARFIDLYGGSTASIRLYRAPARVNLIGEHIDYNGGLVLPAALDMGILMAIRKRSDRRVAFSAMDFPQGSELGLDAVIAHDDAAPWSNYPRGVLAVLRETGFAPDAGFEVLYSSTIPMGSGLSSSAALEVVTAFGLCDIFGYAVSPKEIAVLCQRAENTFVGVNCGIMDQYASALGKRGHALMLDCNRLEHQYVPLVLDGFTFVIANSNKKRGLVDSKYNERRDECDRGLAALRGALAIDYLCDIDSATLDNHMHLIPDAVVRRRVHHVVGENDRVKRAARELAIGNAVGVGQLMTQSHISLRDDYEVTGAELDALFDAALAHPGCAGSRMTGAGFGGCTISLVREDSVEEFIAATGKIYTQKTGLAASWYIGIPSDGVGAL